MRPNLWRDRPHEPSRNFYVRGCRCDGCRAENTRYFAEYRLRGGPKLMLTGASMLWARCWCEAKCRPIPAAEVAAGRTWSCGREECGPLPGEQR